MHLDNLHCVKPATKVLFPGIEFGSTKAGRRLSPGNEPEMRDLTFVEVSGHAFVITTDEGVVLGMLVRQHALVS